MFTIANGNTPRGVYIPALESEISRLNDENRLLQGNVESQRLEINDPTSTNRKLAYDIEELTEFMNQLVNEATLNFSEAEIAKFADMVNAKFRTKAYSEISLLSDKNKSLQANINCKQQLINQLTTENRKQLDKINTLLLLTTDTKSLENELKSLKIQLKNSTEHGQIIKQKMENQRAELKNLNTKSNQVSLLNTEIERLKSQLKAKKQVIHDADRELGTCKNKIEQLEQEIREYGEILRDLDSIPKEESVENSSQECAICCEVFSEDRKRVANGPCGHSMACVECSETMLRKTTANLERGRKSANCPICRTEIRDER